MNEYSIEIGAGCIEPAPIILACLIKRKLFFRELLSFEDDCHALPAADAKRSQTVVQIAALHLVKKSNDNAGTGAADRMAE